MDWRAKPANSRSDNPKVSRAWAYCSTRPGWATPAGAPLAAAVFYSDLEVVAALTAPPSASSAAPTRKGAAVEKRAMRNPHAA